FPEINAPVTIDGSAQPGGLVEIDGSATRPLHSGPYTYVDGLTLNGGSSTVKNLAIWGFSGWGLLLHGGGGNHVMANHIGTDAAAVTTLGNGTDSIAFGGDNLGILQGGGLLIDNSPRNTIGPGNLIAGNRANQFNTDHVFRLSQLGMGMEITGKGRVRKRCHRQFDRI